MNKCADKCADKCTDKCAKKDIDKIAPLSQADIERVVLNGSTYENTKEFRPAFVRGKVVKVYDGDTFHVAGLVKDTCYRFKIRLYGIDCPELKGESKLNGYEVKEYVVTMILNKIVDVEFQPKADKYGRYLARIRIDGQDLTEHLLSKGMGVPYFGGTK